MYKVRFGGKDGKTVNLVESPDMVAIRTRDNQQIDQAPVSARSRELIRESTEVAQFPEAGVSIRRVSAETPDDATRQRDQVRAILKQEESIRFAGRVLQDAQSGEVMLYTENFFLKFKDDVSEANCLALIQKYALKVKSKLVFATNAYFVQAPEGTGLEVFNMAEKLLEEPMVENCHPELVQERRFKAIHPNQWHLMATRIGNVPIDAHVNIQEAWKTTKGKGITIAVIDDGIDPNHPEFAGRIVHPYDATNNVFDSLPKYTEDNHGTACAGMACAAGLPNGASGTAPEATLLPVRLRSGLGSMAEANAFAWAADHGADVISCSWGPTDGQWWNPADPTHLHQTMLPDSTRYALEYVRKKGRGGKGCVVLFAAGNGNEDTANDGYCSYPDVIAVAACNDRGTRSVYSDYGKAVWLSFPSNDYGFQGFQHPNPLTQGLRTTDRVGAEGYSIDNYVETFGGTSAACPGAAGIVALMLAVNPDLSAQQIKELLSKSCNRIDTEKGAYDVNGHSIWYGYGRVDAAKAVANARALLQQPDPTTLPELEGLIKFSVIGDRPLGLGTLTGNFKPARRILGYSFRLKNADGKLFLRYKANIPGVGLVQNSREGEYIGATNNKQRLIGLALSLEGEHANRYDLIYSAKLSGQDQPVTASNGAFCGTAKKTGKSLESIQIFLKPITERAAVEAKETKPQAKAATV